MKFDKNKLRSYRIRENLSIEELGKKIGVTGRTISNYESGKSEPDATALKLLANVFDKSTEDFY